MKKILLIAFLFSGLFAVAQSIDPVAPACECRFKYEINTAFMSPLPVTAINFYGYSSKDAIGWFWQFGDGETSTEQNPTHVYSRPVPSPTIKINPYREVTLIVISADSCKSFYTEQINIMPGEPTYSGCISLWKYYQASYDTVAHVAYVQFDNRSEGDSLTYFWQFGDGQTSTEKKPLIKFDGKQYENKVCLTVTGANKCESTFCDAVYVKNPYNNTGIRDNCYTGFGYKINYDVKTLVPALVLDFYSKADPPAVEWFWDFGDGTTSTEENPMHIFNYPLTRDSILSDPNPFRTVCLTVKTADGCKVSYCETINIYMTPKPECNVWFKYYRPDDIITIPEVVAYQFNEASDQKIVKRLWQFEDGSTSTEPNPLVTFDIFKPMQKVCLTITTESGCESTWCDVLYISNFPPDTVIFPEPPANNYIMRVEASYPVTASACVGYAKAQVYLGDSIVKANFYKWSNGVEGQETKGLCPTQTYSVKAKVTDDIIVSTTFVFNADGTITETPGYWLMKGERDNPVIAYDLTNPAYTVEWKLCDGTVVKSDSIAFNLINCDSKVQNLILRDSLGNVVYTENISGKSVATALNSLEQVQIVNLYPNPVKDVLNIEYKGKILNQMLVEISDITGKMVKSQLIPNGTPGLTIGLNVNELKNGMYICRIVSGNQLVSIKKFVK